jgi:FlaA1/EpsC-like NDP-sugar epimerase
VNGQVDLTTLRDVSIDDLLGRAKVELDWQVIQTNLQQKTVMITGGGGSIGSELCRQVAKLNPRQLIIFERSEFNLYQIELQLRQFFPALTLHAYLGDITDKATLIHILQAYKPQIIFHAAAYKHVPMLQNQVRQAAYNNVLGTQRLAQLASQYQCEKFVMISTDKAVNPTNVMGTTKRIAEIYCQGLNECTDTRFITVRFGNVLGSAGSVVPLFKQQIRRGGPVTVTHPEISRYFMTIPEACQLILQGGAMGQGGEIFVLDMGKPVKIRYLAEQMIRLSGKIPDQDIKIEYTGLRAGEKLHEELFHRDEEFAQTRHQKIFLALHRINHWERTQDLLQQMEQACEVYDEAKILDILQTLVPEMRLGN